MSSRSLNKVTLIGNLTRDPELRYTPQGTAVCTFGVATNRYWVTDSGEKREETEFHRIVSWNKLAELCSQLLSKGRKVYVEGRLQTRSWTAQDGRERSTTEIVIDDMIILDSRRVTEPTVATETLTAVPSSSVPPVTVTTTATVAQVPAEAEPDTTPKKKKAKTSDKKVEDTTEAKPAETVETPVGTEDISPEDIPF